MKTQARHAQFNMIKLVWRPKPHTPRLFVGSLQRAEESYVFTYDGVDIQDAKELGFSGYPGLPLEAGPFNGQAMMAFAARNPSKSRSDYAALLEAWKCPSDADAFTVIGLTGGRLPTDMFEFVPVIEPEVGTEFVSNLAGIRAYEESEVFRSLSPGSPLTLECEPTNHIDPLAVKVLSGGKHVGYIKKGHSAAVWAALQTGLHVECLLDRASVNGVVREVLVRIRFLI